MTGKAGAAVPARSASDDQYPPAAFMTTKVGQVHCFRLFGLSDSTTSTSSTRPLDGGHSPRCPVEIIVEIVSLSSLSRPASRQ
ncbi:Hypothetical protein NTJ_08943 [Nesidiocoris tenuis]|uniref:Uncharacterized protein n=1 Tax=Nesidiocoris tenuis TaxID=355587 RepID=A0ABN7AVC7_9HEMI|nr:Hypothetical protein NTJ_08943 [Nesidiocoris tenuis]